MNNELLLPISTSQSLQLLSVLSSCQYDFALVFDRFYLGGRPKKLRFKQLLESLRMKACYACENWKGLYNCIVENRLDWLIPSYANFLLSLKSLIKFLFNMINLVLFINRIEFFKRQDKVAFIDSTCLPVCKIIRSSRHKTMKDLAKYSKFTMGWYYGLKLHAVVDYLNSKPLYMILTKANIDDRKVLAQCLQSSFFNNSGTCFVGDKGYNAKWIEDLAKTTGNYVILGKNATKNMKVLATLFDIHLLHIRAKIETFFGNLKQNHFITSTRSRSKLGFLFTYISSIFSLVTKKT